MKKDAIIKYLPYGTTEEELKKIRHKFKDKNIALILIISGQEKLLNNLESLINVWFKMHLMLQWGIHKNNNEVHTIWIIKR